MSIAASGATGPQLAHDRIDRYRPLGVFGKPAYQSHVQLRAMLNAKRGARAANYFARPTQDPDLGELRWNAEVRGDVRAWHEMSGDTQAAHALDLEVLRSDLTGFAQELRGQAGGQPGGAASFASLLEQATRVPADGQFLYFVGDQPVIAFWGFEDQGGMSVDPLAQAPRSTPAPTIVPTPAMPPGPGAVPGTTPAADERRRRPWPKWLPWALLAALLVALFVFGLRTCTGTASAPVTGALAVPELPSGPASTAAPRASVDSVPPSGTGGSPPTTGPTAPSGTAPSLGAPAAPTSGMPPDAGTGATPDTVAPESGSEPGTGAGTPPVPEPAPAPSTGNGRAMELPDASSGAAARKLDFLEGDWRAGEGLVDKKTRQPLDLSFKFAREGGGEVTLRRPDGTTCRGAVSGRMDGAKLSIQGSDAVPCSDGGRYGPPRIECARDRSGQTQCFGINPDGSRYFMGMKRQ